MSEQRPALYALTKTRFLEFVRQPEALFWVFGFPVIMSIVLGYAFRDRPLDPVPVGVVEGPGAASLAAALGKPGTLKPTLFPAAAEGNEALRVGKIALLVEEAPELSYRYDPTRPDSRLARLQADDAIERARGRSDVARARDDLVREKGSRYIDFLLPGLLGLNLLSTGLWGIGFSIVDARLKKTLKLMTATPMRRSDYLLSHMLSRFVLIVLETGVILAFGVLVFGVPVRGSLGVLTVLALAGGFTFAGVGLLCAARTQTLEGANGLMNLVAIPMWLGSGTFFSAERFPDALHPVIQALPLTALNNALRSVMLEGRGLSAVLVPLAVLAIWAVTSFAVALGIFRWN